MSKVARDDNAAPLSPDVLGDRFKIYMFAARPNSCFFKLEVINKSKFSKYMFRGFDQLDEKRAIIKSEDLYIGLQGAKER